MRPIISLLMVPVGLTLASTATATQPAPQNDADEPVLSPSLIGGEYAVSVTTLAVNLTRTDAPTELSHMVEQASSAPKPMSSRELADNRPNRSSISFEATSKSSARAPYSLSRHNQRKQEGEKP